MFSEGFQRMEDLQHLAHSEERYRMLVETPDYVVMLVDLEGSYLYISPQTQSWLGYAPEEFYEDPQMRRRIVHLDDLAVVQDDETHGRGAFAA